MIKEKIFICRDCAKFSTDKIKCHKCNSPRILKHDELLSLNIAHIDCDAFYASVEKSLNPQLINKPVIVGGGKRGVVTTCCYIARIKGVKSAIPIFKAKRLCPEAIIIHPKMYKENENVIFFNYEENGKNFMAFFAQPEKLTFMNDGLKQLSPHSDSPAPTDRFLKAGSEMLSKSKTAQFFDRDTTPEMAKAAMQLMVDFMLEPESMMDILEEIEEERSRIFGG